MTPLQLPRTRTTPRVSYSAATETLTLEGDSYPENAFAFFEPILAWVDTWLADPGEAVILDIDVPYMNSSSTKCMLDLLDRFEEAWRRGRPVRLLWHYDPDNSRALDLAEEFHEEVSFPFETVANRA